MLLQKLRVISTNVRPFNDGNLNTANGPFRKHVNGIFIPADTDLILIRIWYCPLLF